MNPSKKQKEHYVPKWYLRNFSSTSDHGYIWVYDTKLKQISEQPINKIAQKQDFYGKEFEDSLDPIDSKTKLVIEKIISSENVDALTNTQLDTLHEFFVLQYYRTEHAKNATEKQLNLNMELHTIPRLRKKYKHVSDADFNSALTELPPPNFFLLNIDMSLKSKKALSDLTPYLIKNNTNIPFITSDDPVTFNNRFHVPKKFLIGFQAVGVQIICPINKRYCLMLIHQEAYDIQTSHNSLIKINAKNDVDLFNVLQILDCNLQVFSKDSSLGYLQRLQKESGKIKKSKPFNQKMQNGNPNVIKEYQDVERRNYGMHFSFLERNANFVREKWPRFSTNTPPEIPFIRNKDIYDEVKVQTDLFISSFLKEYQEMLEQQVNNH